MSREIFCTLKDFLQRYGWSYQSDSDENIVTGWHSDGRSFKLSIGILETWVTFRVDPLIDMTIDWENWPELAQFVLEQNDSCSMVRFSINHGESLAMSLDIFTDQLSYEVFSQSISLIGYYSEQFYSEFLGKLDQLGLMYDDTLNFLA